jgi:ureidoglycolate hydrolase
MDRKRKIMNKEYIDITTYEGEGYKPVIDYETWRVAILNYCEELEIQNLKTMQKHNETDEVFVLLKGNCTLFSGGKGDEVNDIDGVAMKPLQLYNVKRGVWHTHTLDKDGMVLIVENKDTSDVNSPTEKLTPQQMEQLHSIYNQA